MKTYNYYPKGSESQRLHEGSQTTIIVMPKEQPDKFNIFTDEPILSDGTVIKCPLGQPGSIIHVKEAWQLYFHPHEQPTEPTFIYKSEGTSTGVKWRSPVTMPLEAIRTKLINKGVQFKPVQELNQDDIIGWLKADNPNMKYPVGSEYIQACFQTLVSMTMTVLYLASMKQVNIGRIPKCLIIKLTRKAGKLFRRSIKSMGAASPVRNVANPLHLTLTHFKP